MQFRRREDRYEHDVWLADDGDWIRVLTSMEGSPADRWPASPPLQSLHTEVRGDQRQVALSVGMAGKSHWSASAELDPASARIHFEIACRLAPGPSGPLGSRYESLASVIAVDARSAIIASPSATGYTVRLALDDECVCGTRLVVAEGQIEIALPADLPGDSPQTVRWGYTISRLRA